MGKCFMMGIAFIVQQIGGHLAQKLESQIVVGFEILMNSTHTNFKVVKYELVLIGAVDYSLYQLVEDFRFYLGEAFFVLDDLWEEESGQISVVYKHI